ncbi:lysyl-trna synthetase [Ophiostoma piceae UAMH 11346]|uniref:Lysyl-tRNA synthetase n=1 Tax=Ophiostoma piceae (strain UAMH 11346) TaxID=1262450 RepID=S3C7V0_OPHP1|nr:lysyl-trna synthetase [Ophiostoma piceae UAMH 11346]
MSAPSTALPGLVFLRPYAVLRPSRVATLSTARAVSTVSTTARSAAYSNFYLAACRSVPSLRSAPVSRAAAASKIALGRRFQSSETSAKDSTGRTEKAGRTKSKKKEQAAAVNGESRNSSDDAVSEDRSLTTLRIKELSEAGALNYPRYQLAVDDEDCRLSVPEFRARFESITKPSDGEPEASAASESGLGTERAVPQHPRVEIAGRVLSVRRMGSKLAFVRLLDEGQQVQVMCNLRKFGSDFIEPHDAKHGITLVSVAEFKNAMRVLSRGDHVSFTGYAMRTPTGELTLDADSMPRMYTPTLAPLPARLSDGDTRALRRHLDLLVNAEVASTLRLRSQIMREMRAFFESQRFVEVQTPILADLAGGAAARPFVTTHGEAAAGDPSQTRNLSMRIAPELWLKRLVVGGLDRVFEIGPSFRNEGIDATHNPEFTMCEFYAAYWTLPKLMYQTELLLTQLARSAIKFRRQQGSQLPTDSYISPEKVSASVNRIAAGPPFLLLEFIPALEEALGFALPDLSAPDAYDQLRQLLAANGHAAEAGAKEVGDADGGRLAKLLDRLAGTHLEPRSVTDPHGRPFGPLFIIHHPACMSPLAKCFVCPRTGQTVAARAELFVDGRELANMYEEENDPAEQRRKMQLQAQEQANDNSVDENYIAALESGLPPTGGWGCGIERLVMLLSGAPRISDCLSFGTLQHVVAMKK